MTLVNGGVMNVPQVMAIEFRVDRVDFSAQPGWDLEDMVLWVKVLDLPCLEMAPYSRNKQKLYYSSTDSSADEAERKKELTRDESKTDAVLSGGPKGPIKINKKSTGNQGNPTTNKSDSTLKLPDTIRRRSATKKSEGKRKSVTKVTDRKSKTVISDNSLKDKKETSKPSLTNRDELTENELRKSKTSKTSKSDSSIRIKSRIEELKVDEILRQSLEEDVINNLELEAKLKFKEEQQQTAKKIKLLSRLEPSIPEEIPEGIAFNSDCCCLLPFGGAAQAIYKMERIPIIVYLIRKNPCSTAEGKVSIKMDYSYQEAVVRAARAQGATVSFGVQTSFPISRIDSDRVVGKLLGSLNLIGYGEYGVTEIKSSTGDLMVGRLRQWKSAIPTRNSRLPDDSQLPSSNPYGLEPVITCPNMPLAPNKKRYEIRPSANSMFHNYYNFYSPSKPSSKSNKFDRLLKQY